MSESLEIPVLAPAPVMPGLRVAVLGAGKMGGILLQAFLKNNLLAPEQIFATVQHAERAQALSAQFGVEITTNNLAAAQQADVILLGVKPTQVPALIEEINPDTGRVHTCFAQSVAATGRLSSNDPNLQNIPIRTEEGSRIRRAFIAEMNSSSTGKSRTLCAITSTPAASRALASPR